MNRFNPGQVVATPGALAALEASGESLFDYLARHLSGDWGDVDPEDARENELSLKHDWPETAVPWLRESLSHKGRPAPISLGVNG